MHHMTCVDSVKDRFIHAGVASRNIIALADANPQCVEMPLKRLQILTLVAVLMVKAIQ